MERVTRIRAIILLALFCLVLVLYAGRLFKLQIIETDGNNDNTTTYTTLTTVRASRGDLLDRNGNVLVGNRASYDLVFNHYVIKSYDETNEALYTLLKKCDELGVAYSDHFPVTTEEPFEYTLASYAASWQNHFQSFMVDRELDSDMTAPLLMEELRVRYKIPVEWTSEEARAIIGLRYEFDLRGVSNLPNYIFIEDVSDEHLSAILELNTPGLMVESSTVREYHTKYAAHILGYVGPMNAEQWETYKNNDDYNMESHIGQTGFEAAFEEYLHGVDGLREDTVTTSGELVSSRYLVEPKAGSNVEVSIDINLQRAAEDAMEELVMELRANPEGDGHDAVGGAVVAINTRTGQVLVCSSYPTYDLSTFFENYNAILEAEGDPLFNRALQGIYAPGSTYKMSVAIAAIDSGVINSADTIYDKGIWDQDGSAIDKYKDFQLYCLQYTNYGRIHQAMNASQALQVSCNYFFYELGDRLGLSVMDSTAKSLGLGELTGIELPERQGYRANEETKKLLYTGGNASWFQADQITSAIGQSDNRFTPIQLAVYAGTLANRGTRYRSTFLNRVVSADYRSLLYQYAPAVMSTMTISDDAYLAYSQGMHMVTKKGEEWSGTAYSTFKDYPIEVAAKTGTPQVAGDSSDNGAFVCYAPFDQPEIAVAVYGEKFAHGSTAARVGKAVLDAYFQVGDVSDVITEENQPS